MKQKITLLYADDEVSTRKNHIDYLKLFYDFEYIEANDGQEALALFKEHKPEIILTDITMPHMDGLEFISKVRAISPFSNVVIISAYDEVDKLKKALSLSVINYMIKPVNRRELKESVQRALDTLHVQEKINTEQLFLDEAMYWDKARENLFVKDSMVELSNSQKRLLDILSQHKNSQVSAIDIFLHVWSEFDKEFTSESVRTLVKELRKKLPKECLINIYGGYYQLNTL